MFFLSLKPKLIIILLICYFLLSQNSTNAMINGENEKEHEQGSQKRTGESESKFLIEMSDWTKFYKFELMGWNYIKKMDNLNFISVKVSK